MTESNMLKQKRTFETKMRGWLIVILVSLAMWAVILLAIREVVK